MTNVVKCDKCGDEAVRYSDHGYLRVGFSMADHEDEERHYCPSCASDILSTLGVAMKKYEYECKETPLYARGD